MRPFKPPQECVPTPHYGWFAFWFPFEQRIGHQEGDDFGASKTAVPSEVPRSGERRRGDAEGAGGGAASRGLRGVVFEAIGVLLDRNR